MHSENKLWWYICMYNAYNVFHVQYTLLQKVKFTVLHNITCKLWIICIFLITIVTFLIVKRIRIFIDITVLLTWKHFLYQIEFHYRSFPDSLTCFFFTLCHWYIYVKALLVVLFAFCLVCQCHQKILKK